MNKVITLERLDNFYTDFKEKIKENYYSKSEVDTLINDVEIDTTNLLDKNTYDSDNDGIVDVAKTIDGVSERNLNKMIETFNLLSNANPQQYIGTNADNEFGLHYFPINTRDNTGIEQRVALNVKNNEKIIIDSALDISNNKIVVDCYKFVEGEDDIISNIKTFNNAEKNNFFYDEENIEFTNSMHIKKEYEIYSKENDAGYYETDIIDKDTLYILANIEEGGIV